MKVKRNKQVIEIKDESEVEAGDEVVEESTEEAEEDENETKELRDSISKKLDSLIKMNRENPASKSVKYHKEEATHEKSVMQEDKFLRKTTPFVKLSGEMDKFIKDVKVLAKGGIPAALIKALNEGNDSEGGFTVPEEFNAEVVRYATEASIVRPRARVWNMTRDIWKAPKLDQDFDSDSDDFGGVSFSYIEEGAEKQESQPRFGRVTLRAKKLVGLTVASDELLEDSAVNLANFLVSLYGEALGWLEDKQFLQGSGVGRPLGIINSADVNVATRATAATIGLNDLLGMRKALRPVFRSNSIWIMNTNAEDAILKINSSTTEGVKLLGNLSDGVPTTLLGRPFIVTDKLPNVAGNKGDIILGDLSRYFVGDRGALQVASSMHDRFRFDETVLRFVKRHDGQPAIPEAFVVLEEKL